MMIANKTNAKLLASLQLDKLTPMELAQAGSIMKQCPPFVEAAAYIVERSGRAFCIAYRLPVVEVIKVWVRRCLYKCPGCAGLEQRAEVNGIRPTQLLCEKCMAPYWEQWRHTLSVIFNQIVQHIRSDQAVGLPGIVWNRNHQDAQSFWDAWYLEYKPSFVVEKSETIVDQQEPS